MFWGKHQSVSKKRITIIQVDTRWYRQGYPWLICLVEKGIIGEIASTQPGYDEVKAEEEKKVEDADDVIGKGKDKQEGSDEDPENIQKQLEDHFEGVGKKNTRKKKNKQQNMYG